MSYNSGSWRGFTLTDAHRGEPIFIGCTGPSMEGVDLPLLCNGRVVIGCNNFPTFYVPDYFVVCDPNGWVRYKYLVCRYPKMTTILGQHAATLGTHSYPTLFYPMKAREGFDPEVIHHGREVGVVMVNVAIRMGASDIYIIGMDGFVPGRQANAGDPALRRRDPHGSKSATKCLAAIRDYLEAQGRTIYLVEGQSSVHKDVVPVIGQDVLRELLQ